VPNSFQECLSPPPIRCRTHREAHAWCTGVRHCHLRCVRRRNDGRSTPPRRLHLLNKHSPAARDGRLCVGDQIVKINEATIPEALALIERAASEADFVAVNNEAGLLHFGKRRAKCRLVGLCAESF